MSKWTVAFSIGSLAMFSLPSGAQEVLAPPDYYGAQTANAQPQQIDPNDTDDEDGYDAEYDVYYDNAAAQNYDDGYDPNAYQQFESALQPYGNWVDVPSYGHVWMPSSTYVGVDFTPYASGGHWALTEYGWTWVSDWPWGWAPFHYGRWMDVGGFGWCWIPGSIWGPAWVSWRFGGGYVGWAPLPPRGVTVGPPRGIRTPWRFTLAHQLGATSPSYLPHHVVPSVFAHTSVVTNVRAVPGLGVTARINAGPSLTTAWAPRATPLASIAPRALPHPSVVARPGQPIAARPWARALPPSGALPPPRPGSIPIRPGVPSRSIPIGPRPAPARSYNGQLYVAPHQPTSSFHYSPAPTYRAAPSTSYRPAYPTQTYRAPSYQAPAPTWRAPTPSYRAAPMPSYHAAPMPYRAAPAPSYHAAPAPSYRAAPMPSYQAAPTFHPAPAPAFHSAPSMHFGGGGRRR